MGEKETLVWRKVRSQAKPDGVIQHGGARPQAQVRSERSKP